MLRHAAALAIGLAWTATRVRARWSRQRAGAALQFGDRHRRGETRSSGGLLWNTFLGGGGSQEYGIAIARDTGGNLYVGGQGNATWGSPIHAFTAGQDAFVAKLDPSGALQWNTFLGSSVTGAAINAIAPGAGGGIFVAGQMGGALDTSPIRPFSGNVDAFVARLEPNSSLTWHTFLGAGGFDTATGLSFEPGGTIDVVGQSTTSWGTPSRPYSAGSDAFLAQLDTSGGLLSNTFLGGSATDYAGGVVSDGAGYL